MVVRDLGIVAAAPRRAQPLALEVGHTEVLLLATDVNLLVGGIEQLVTALDAATRQRLQPPEPETLRRTRAEFAALERFLTTTSPWSLGAPAVRLDADQVRQLRVVLAELTGYQRGDLTPGLRELRGALGT